MSYAGLFPGQGAQSVGMLAELIAAAPELAQTLAEASAALGEDLARLAAEGPPERLSQTRNTQPVLLALEVGLWRVWRARGAPAPAYLAGHSFGEYAALVAAGALRLADAVPLVRRRGELMQDAAADGGMAAVLGLADAQAERLCAEASTASECVQVANYNAPGQVVLSGHRRAVRRAGDACRQAGARRVLELAVSVPAHSALMRPAHEAFRAALEATPFAAPRIAVVNNVDTRVETEPARIRDALARQLHSPVRWSRGVQWLARQGVSIMAELGPGRILAGLNRRIDRDLRSLCIDTPEALDAACKEVRDAR